MSSQKLTTKPGLIALFGSGETAVSSQKIYDTVLRTLPQPVKSSIVETPAGFEPNSPDVAGRVGTFLEQHLPNYDPQVTIVAARKKNSPYSPDDPDIVAPMFTADHIHLGAGSPTYAARQLNDTLAWQIIQARHLQGAGLTFASAATLAVSQHTLPVYEIYKVGEELHWKAGLDFFSMYGLSLVIVPHWNNTDGGTGLDTSRCYVGRNRFAQLETLLPDAPTILGLDEHTAVIFDFAAQTCQVMGNGRVTVIRDGQTERFLNGESFRVDRLGAFQQPDWNEIVSAEIWEMIETAVSAQNQPQTVPPDVALLVEKREKARADKNWSQADALRERITAMGWTVADTPAGPELVPQ